MEWMTGCVYRRGRYLVPDAVLMVLICFFINLAYCGVVYGGSGILLQAFMDALQAGKARTALSISLQNGFMLIGGLLSSPVIERYGTRATSVVGGLMATIGLFAAAFSTSIIHLDITFGIISGAGCGFLQLPTSLSVQQHTRKRRALASGLGLTGAGVGVMVVPHIIDLALVTYGWRGTLLILSGLLLHTVPCGMLLFPPEHKPKATINSVEQKSTEPSTETLTRQSPGDGPGALKECETEDSKQSEQLMPPNDNNVNKNHGHIRAFLVSIMPSAPIFTDPVCVTLMLAMFCTYSSLNIPYVYVPVQIRTAGLPLSTSADVISVSGVVNIVGRLLGSLIGSVTDTMPFYTLVVAILLTALSTIGLVFCGGVLGITLVMSLHGFALGVGGALIYTVIRDLAGVARFHWISGVGFTTAGIGNIIVLQLMAVIWELTDSLVWPYLIGGGLMMIATICFCMSYGILRMRQRVVSAKEVEGIIQPT